MGDNVGDTEERGVPAGLSALHMTAFLAAPETERYERFQELAHYIMDTAIILPICFERRQVLTHRGVVSGLVATQFDLFFNIKDWNVNLN